jgi:Tfp pilus assembly protein PilF
MCLALALWSLGGLTPVYGHHPGHHNYWMGGYMMSGYPAYLGWSPYGSAPMVVTGMSVYGPQAGVGFGGMGGFGGGPVVGGGQVGGGPALAGPMVGGQVGGAAQGAAANGGVAPVGPADFQQHGKPRATNTESKARAGKLIQHGDLLFAKQKYNSAMERYREAATTAPDLAEVYFRQTFALIASSQYDSAKKSLERGLRVRPNWPDANFELAALYGVKNHLARLSHREALASAIEQSPQSADLLLLMGVLLYSDGQRDRSQLFFDRAIELGANADHLFDHFIAPRPGPEPAPPEDKGANL